MAIHNSKVDNFIKVLSFKSCGQGAGRTTGVGEEEGGVLSLIVSAAITGE